MLQYWVSSSIVSRQLSNYSRRTFITNQIRTIYEDMVEKDLIMADNKQIALLRYLDRINQDLIDDHPNWKRYLKYEKEQWQQLEQQELIDRRKSEYEKRARGTFYMKLFGGGQSQHDVLQNQQQKSVQQVQKFRMKQIKGLYVFGTPGCGKTFVMDLFYNNLKIKEKSRIHFNEFMLNIHRMMHKAKEEQKEDPIETVAIEQSFEQRVLCLDEFQVTDIADALILKRLFEKMMNQQTVVIMTSNRVPEDLYKNGLQRHVFEPFIPFLREKTEVVDMDSSVDYRYSNTEEYIKQFQTFVYPLNQQNNQEMDRIFTILSQHQKMYLFYFMARTSKRLNPYEGRFIDIEVQANGIAQFEFDDLCNRTYGSSDFIAIARNFHAIVLKNIPVMNLEDRNVARRFILLIDELYNNKVKLYCSSEKEISQIFQIEDGNNKTDEYFALQRCISRLIEMQSQKYIGENSYHQSRGIYNIEFDF